MTRSHGLACTWSRSRRAAPISRPRFGNSTVHPRTRTEQRDLDESLGSPGSAKWSWLEPDRGRCLRGACGVESARRSIVVLGEKGLDVGGDGVDFLLEGEVAGVEQDDLGVRCVAAVG